MPSSRTPPGLVSYDALLRAIANHCHPDPVNLAGLPGVVGKRFLDPGTRIWRATVPLTAEDETLLRELTSKHAAGMPESLPALQPVMGRKESLAFRRAFRKMDGRPEWEPVLRTPDDRWRLQSLRGDVCLRHDLALKKQIADERMRHFDDDRMPAPPHFERISYLVRDEVETYLKKVGLDLQILMAGPSEPSASAESAFIQESRSLQSASTPLSPQTQKRRRQWSAEDRRMIIEASTAGQLEQIATEIGVSLQYAKQLASRFEKEDAAKRHTAWATSSEPALQANVTVEPVLRETGTTAPTAHAMQAPTAQPTVDRAMLRMPDVERRIGLKRSSIYARLDPKSKYYDKSFPRPVSLTGAPAVSNEDYPTGGAIGFYRDQIDGWLASRPKR